MCERGRFGASATPAGELLTARARLVLAEIQRAENELAELSDTGRGSVSIGLGRSLTTGPIADVIAGFAAAHGEARLSVSEGWSPDLHRRLIQGEFDFVVSSPQPGFSVDPELSAEVLFRQVETLMIGRRHPLGRKDPLELADLSGALWAMPPRALNRTEHLRRAFTASGVEPPRRFIRSDSDTFGRHLIREGHAIGLANVHVMTRDIEEGEIRALSFPQLDIERDVVLAVRRRSRSSPLAVAVIGAIRSRAA